MVNAEVVCAVIPVNELKGRRGRDYGYLVFTSLQLILAKANDKIDGEMLKQAYRDAGKNPAEDPYALLARRYFRMTSAEIMGDRPGNQALPLGRVISLIVWRSNNNNLVSLLTGPTYLLDLKCTNIEKRYYLSSLLEDELAALKQLLGARVAVRLQ
jgi:hypothetical protein